MSKEHVVRVAVGGSAQWGVVREQRVFALTGSPFDPQAPGSELGAVPDMMFLAPVQPSKIICVGRNYPAHAAEHQAPLPVEPLLFFKPPSSVIGPGAEIVLPSQSQQVEHEAELAIVIGRHCHHVSAEQAWQYVWGVTCGNDVTARDLQRQDPLWTRAKGFDTFCALGPWVVTELDAQDVADLRVISRVNGQVRQDGCTREMVFSPADLIAYISQIMTLEPGDVLMTGTPAGVGPLVPGDVVEIEVQNIGVLRNPVRDSR